jgi:hypothetical protein
MAFSPLRLNTNTTFPNVLPLDFAGQENPYLISPELSGRFMKFFGEGEEDEEDAEKDENENKMTDYEKEKLGIMRDSIEFRNRLLSPEERDAEYKRADDLAAKQMQRAQEYGKESAMYGYLYQGLPSQIAQAAFSKYAFAPEMVKGVQDAYSRLNTQGAIRGPQYMQINA